MRNTQGVGAKPSIIQVNVHNTDTVAIPQGTPIVYKMNGTNDGLDVVLPSTGGSDAQSYEFFAGVATTTMNVGDYGSGAVFGIYNAAVLEIRTRAGTSGGSSWSAVASLQTGVCVSLDSANNAFSTVASTITVGSGTSNSYVQTLGYPAIKGFLASSIASLAGVATSTSDSRTVSTIAAAVFLRVM